MSESHILKLFTSMTLGETSGKLNKEASLEEKKKDKKLHGIRKSNNKKKPKKMKEHGMEEWRKFCELWKRRKETDDRWYYGVKKSASGAMFFAEIVYPDGRLVCLGTYRTPRLAAIAYDKVAFKLYGSEAMLNFLHFVRNKPVMMDMALPRSSSDND